MSLELFRRIDEHFRKIEEKVKEIEEEIEREFEEQIKQLRGKVPNNIRGFGKRITLKQIGDKKEIQYEEYYF